MILQPKNLYKEIDPNPLNKYDIQTYYLIMFVILFFIILFISCFYFYYLFFIL